MLKRQRQIRAQIQKILDAGLFAAGLWLAHWIRSDYLRIAILGGTREIQPLSEFFWLFVIIIPAAPVLLEMQGFYRRPLFVRRRVTVWQLFKACFSAFGAYRYHSFRGLSFLSIRISSCDHFKIYFFTAFS